jgi:hypothetical protein
LKGQEVGKTGVDGVKNDGEQGEGDNKAPGVTVALLADLGPQDIEAGHHGQGVESQGPEPGQAGVDGAGPTGKIKQSLVRKNNAGQGDEQHPGGRGGSG